MSTFPTFARILREDYSTQSDRGLVRSDMDDGIAKQRFRYTQAITNEQITIYVSRGDRDMFDVWVDNMAAGWFSYRQPFGRAKRARITAPYTWEPHGPGWTAKLSLECL